MSAREWLRVIGAVVFACAVLGFALAIEPAIHKMYFLAKGV